MQQQKIETKKKAIADTRQVTTKSKTNDSKAQSKGPKYRVAAQNDTHVIAEPDEFGGMTLIIKSHDNNNANKVQITPANAPSTAQDGEIFYSTSNDLELARIYGNGSCLPPPESPLKPSGLFSHMAPYKIDYLHRGAVKKVSTIQIHEGHKCVYITEMWRDMWLVCPDDNLLLVYKHDGTFQCEVSTAPLLERPRAAAQISGTQACIIAQDGVFVMDISKDSDMFELRTRGNFGAISVAKDIAYIVVLDTHTIFKTPKQCEKWGVKENTIYLKCCPDLTPNDTLCVTADNLFIYHVDSRNLLCFTLDGSPLSRCEHKDHLSICAYSANFFLMCEFQKYYADLIIQSLSMSKISSLVISGLKQPIFCYCGRKRSIWIVCADGTLTNYVCLRNRTEMK